MPAAYRSSESLEAKTLGQEFSDVAFLVAVRALIENDRVRAELVDDLAACAARRAGNVLSIRHGNSEDSKSRTRLRDCAEDCSAFSTVRHSIRRVFDVAAGKNVAFGCENCGSDFEI